MKTVSDYISEMNHFKKTFESLHKEYRILLRKGNFKVLCKDGKPVTGEELKKLVCTVDASINA